MPRTHRRSRLASKDARPGWQGDRPFGQVWWPSAASTPEQREKDDRRLSRFNNRDDEYR